MNCSKLCGQRQAPCPPRCSNHASRDGRPSALHTGTAELSIAQG
ncbi:hypothetical protein AB0B51_30640 [Streptomyces griseus]|nr:hypothetical protein [Streptomyces griseus]